MCVHLSDRSFLVTSLSSQVCPEDSMTMLMLLSTKFFLHKKSCGASPTLALKSRASTLEDQHCALLQADCTMHIDVANQYIAVSALWT
jgi:hypothetical protein